MMPAGILYIADTMKQGPCIDCGESRLRSALKIAGGSLSGGGSLGGPSLYKFDGTTTPNIRGFVRVLRE